MTKQAGLRLALKRAVDMSLAGVALSVAAPVMVGAAVAIRFNMGSPVLFRQRRPGKGGAVFEALKFRTMRDAVDASGKPLPDGQRLTALGRIIRRTSVDELPQLVNVLRGEMSLVGPRPLLMDYLDRYTPQQMRRHDVLPGVTGWAQVNGRNATTWEERFAQDLWYVDHWSLALDLRIILMTISKVVRGSGISNPGHETMPEFMGTLASTGESSCHVTRTQKPSGADRVAHTSSGCSA